MVQQGESKDSLRPGDTLPVPRWTNAKLGNSLGTKLNLRMHRQWAAFPATNIEGSAIICRNKHATSKKNRYYLLSSSQSRCMETSCSESPKLIVSYPHLNTSSLSHLSCKNVVLFWRTTCFFYWLNLEMRWNRNMACSKNERNNPYFWKNGGLCIFGVELCTKNGSSCRRLQSLVQTWGARNFVPLNHCPLLQMKSCSQLVVLFLYELLIPIKRKLIHDSDSCKLEISQRSHCKRYCSRSSRDVTQPYPF